MMQPNLLTESLDPIGLAWLEPVSNGNGLKLCVSRGRNAFTTNILEEDNTTIAIDIFGDADDTVVGEAAIARVRETFSQPRLLYAWIRLKYAVILVAGDLDRPEVPRTYYFGTFDVPASLLVALKDAVLDVGRHGGNHD